MKQKVWILGGLWLAFFLLNLLTPNRVFSEAENRYLAKRPELEAKEVLDGDYMEDYEIWMSDQLLFRDGFVGLKATSDKALGRGDSGGVYLGKDGYLLEELQELDEEKLKKNTTVAAGFLKGLKAQGVEGHFLMVPTGACIMKDKLPPFAPELSQEELFKELAAELPGFLDVTETLKAARERSTGKEAADQLYYRTDHHWTSLGAYYAYEAFCRETDREVPDLSEYEIRTLSEEFYGTSYARAGLYILKPDIMTSMLKKDGVKVQVDYGTGEAEDSLYDESFLSRRDKYRVFLKGNYPLTRITTSNQNGEKLLLIKDSYANTFVQFLVEDYEEIHMIDPRLFRQNPVEYAREQGITEVLFLYQIKNFAEDTALAGIR